MGWATFWAIKKTHLVGLHRDRSEGRSFFFFFSNAFFSLRLPHFFLARSVFLLFVRNAI
jgi:hypothetical protein